MATKIVIEVVGGVVQDLYCDHPDVVAVIVDWDTEGSEPGTHAYAVEDEDGNEHLAFAEVIPATPMEKLPLETWAAAELAQA